MQSFLVNEEAESRETDVFLSVTETPSRLQPVESHFGQVKKSHCQLDPGLMQGWNGPFYMNV